MVLPQTQIAGGVLVALRFELFRQRDLTHKTQSDIIIRLHQFDNGRTHYLKILIMRDIAAEITNIYSAVRLFLFPCRIKIRK